MFGLVFSIAAFGTYVDVVGFLLHDAGTEVVFCWVTVLARRNFVKVWLTRCKNGDDKVTLIPTPIFSVHNWALKKNQLEGPPFTDHILAIFIAKEPMAFKAPKPSSQIEKKDSKGKMPGAKT
ncbi:hypothetical protein Tco_0589887 [Tanacetum coccineum]